MIENGFGLAVAAVASASWLAGFATGFYLDSTLCAAVTAFILSASAVVVFGKAIGRAWWSVNREKATKSDFKREAKQSLSFVVWISLALSVIFGMAAYFADSVSQGAFAGLMLGMAVFGLNRLRDVSARTTL